MNKLDGKQDILIELYVNQRLHVEEVADILNVGKNTVVRALDKYGIKKSDRFPEAFTAEQKSVLYGSLLGDANLCIQPRGHNACLRLEHSIKQAAWLQYKFNVFKPWINAAKPTIYAERKQANGTSTPSIKFTTVAVPLFTEVYHQFYKNNIKIVDESILEEIDSLALATWFCDDGSYNYNPLNYNKVMKIATCAFSTNELKTVINYFKERWNINCSLMHAGANRTYPNILFNTEGARKIVEIIRPHIIPSMLYKLDPHLKCS